MLDLNIGVMLIVAGIFLVTLVLLKMWLFDPLVKFMEDREKRLKEELEMINANTDESQKIEAEIKEIFSAARDDAKRIINEAREKALKEAEEVKQKKLKEIEEAKESFKLMIEKEKEEMLKELLKEKETMKSVIDNKIRNVA